MRSWPSPQSRQPLRLGNCAGWQTPGASAHLPFQPWYSRRLLPLIEWEPTGRGNVRVLNDTADFYRFFDATPHAEFLFECVKRTIEEDLPDEADFLRRYDRFTRRLQAIVDMPDRIADLLFRFLHQNAGRLSMRAREREFRMLTNEEAARVERLYDDAFGPPPESRRP